MLGQLDDAGFASTRGQVGADDPLTAFDDARGEMYRRPITSSSRLGRGDHADWQERGGG